MRSVKEQLTFEIVLTIIGLLVGYAVGVVFSLLSPAAAPGMSGLVGAVGFLFTQMLALRIRVDQNTKLHQETLASLASSMFEEDADRMLLEIGLAHADRDLSAELTTTVWRQLTWYTQRDYCATNFLEPSEFYGSGQAENTLRLQKTKLRAQPNFTLKKVLIWDGSLERDSKDAKDVVGLHLDDPKAPMTLTGILREEIEKNALLSGALRDQLSNQIDFGIFDDMVVLVWTLDDKRKPKGGKVFVGDTRVAAFRAFFDALIQEAQPLGA